MDGVRICRRGLLAGGLAGMLAVTGGDDALGRKRRRRSGTGCASSPAAAGELLGMVNAWRARKGLGNLVLEPRLMAAAQTRSKAMAKAGKASHTIGGVSIGENLRNHGYPAGDNGVATGENIAQGFTSACQVFAFWKNSPPHNANLLDKRFRGMGIGYATAPGTGRAYWTLTFGSVA